MIQDTHRVARQYGKKNTEEESDRPTLGAFDLERMSGEVDECLSVYWIEYYKRNSIHEVKKDCNRSRNVNTSDRLALLCVGRLRKLLPQVAGVSITVDHQQVDDAQSHSGICGYQNNNTQLVHATIASCFIGSVKAKLQSVK